MDPQKLKEIAEKQGLSQRDAEKIKNQVRILASRSVKKFLILYTEHVAKQRGYDKVDKKQLKKENAEEFERYSAYKRFSKKLERFKVESYTGGMTITIDPGGKNLDLMCQIEVVPRDYEVTIMVEERSKPAVFHWWDRLTDMAKAYYHILIATENMQADLAEFIPDIDFSDMKMNKNNRTLYFDEQYEYRIGVLMYYIDTDGKPMIITDEEAQEIKPPERVNL